MMYDLLAALDIEKWIATFSWFKRKNKNSRDNTKRAEKSYFYCGPPAEKVIKST